MAFIRGQVMIAYGFIGILLFAVMGLAGYHNGGHWWLGLSDFWWTVMGVLHPRTRLREGTDE